MYTLEKLVKGDLQQLPFRFEKVKYDPEHFRQFLTEYFDNLEKPYPPEIPEKCKDNKQRQHCFMHSFFMMKIN